MYDSPHTASPTPTFALKTPEGPASNGTYLGPFGSPQRQVSPHRSAPVEPVATGAVGDRPRAMPSPVLEPDLGRVLDSLEGGSRVTRDAFVAAYVRSCAGTSSSSATICDAAGGIPVTVPPPQGPYEPPPYLMDAPSRESSVRTVAEGVVTTPRPEGPLVAPASRHARGWQPPREDSSSPGPSVPRRPRGWQPLREHSGSPSLSARLAGLGFHTAPCGRPVPARAEY